MTVLSSLQIDVEVKRQVDQYTDTEEEVENH